MTVSVKNNLIPSNKCTIRYRTLVNRHSFREVLVDMNKVHLQIKHFIERFVTKLAYYLQCCMGEDSAGNNLSVLQFDLMVKLIICESVSGLAKGLNISKLSKLLSKIF